MKAILSLSDGVPGPGRSLVHHSGASGAGNKSIAIYPLEAVEVRNLQRGMGAAGVIALLYFYLPILTVGRLMVTTT